MAHTRLATALALALFACGSPPEDDDDTPAGETPEVPSGPCVSDADFFEDVVFPQVLEPNCMGCHTIDGVANDSDFVLVGTTRTDHLQVNRATLADLAGLERDGTSIVLLKPLGEDNHGGNKILDESDEAYQNLVEFVQRVKAPVECDDDDLPTTNDPDHGLAQLSPRATLRKAGILLNGRLPSPAEDRRVRTGGESALVQVLWEMMAEPAFADRMMEVMNDQLHTDRYLIGRDGIGIFDDERYPSVYWYESTYGDDDYNTFRQRTSDAIAREPMALIGHIVRNDRPWTEVLTANYTVLDAYGAQAYGVGTTSPEPFNGDSDAFNEYSVPGIPHAGILTMPAFLNRYPTTPTNRNRHRAWFVYKQFLATDILNFADRPIDPTISNAHNPTLNDAQCTICHATLDPVAGAFQNWDEEGTLNPREEGWYGDMVTPGFGDDGLPAVERSKALQWLAERTTQDPRFGVATVRSILEAFTGLQLLTPQTAAGQPALVEALEIQDDWIEGVASEFIDRGHDIKWVVEQVVLSHWFRSHADKGNATPGALHNAGTAHLLTPEELDRKILATTGLLWRESSNRESFMSDRYEMLYGGIDSFGVLERLNEPNGIIANIGLRMSNDVSCEAVPRDLLVPQDQRRLLPFVEASWMPETAEGFDVPEAQAAIRENIVWLHYRLLGEDLSVDDPEIEHTYQLFYALWKEGLAGVNDDSIDHNLPNDCRATSDWWTGASLSNDYRVVDDSNHTIRAWMGVVAYLLADYRFLYE